MRELCNAEFTYINVLIDTDKFDKRKISSTLLAYNYACRYTLERAFYFLEAKGKTADIVLSSRGTSKDSSLIEYIKYKLIPNLEFKDVFREVSTKKSSEWDMLQLADVCATTTFLTYETNQYGFNIPCFLNALSQHLYQKNGKIKNYGIKFFSDIMVPDCEEIKTKYVCAKKERTPGTTTTCQACW